MATKNRLMIGNDTKTNEDIFLKEGNLLIVGKEGATKNDTIVYPVLNQMISQKDVGITIFDHTGLVSKVAYAIAKKNRRKIFYVDPMLRTVKFNPLRGSEDDVISNFVQFFCSYNTESPRFFIDTNSRLLTYSIKVLKTTMGENATLLDLQRFMENIKGFGRHMVARFSRVSSSDPMTIQEQELITSWFLQDYFNDKSKVYEYTSGVRAFLMDLLSNKAIAKMFNTSEEGEFLELDFKKHIENKEVVIVNTNPADLGGAYSKIQTLIALHLQNVILHETKPVPHMLYFKELLHLRPLFSDLFKASSFDHTFAMIAEMQNGFHYEYHHNDYKNGSFISSFPNVVIMPGTVMKEEFRNTIFSRREVEIMEDADADMDQHEFYYRMIDSCAKGYTVSGAAKGAILPAEESEFLQKRIKRYTREFENQKRFSGGVVSTF
ncbi:hypothetical protein JOD82_002033 [Paenibacillus sp. 1182]|uniref:TraG/TraD n=1 Tax=Paenibacillus sp. 1182 TaxID=2806565 RepID=UPI001AE43246|nr:TraG/TraD [Paenibacillus sp. 1182]MBP1309013.1 hypothetical protein [Paenibacillus sp. 1182]